MSKEKKTKKVVKTVGKKVVKGKEAKTGKLKSSTECGIKDVKTKLVKGKKLVEVIEKGKIGRPRNASKALSACVDPKKDLKNPKKDLKNPKKDLVKEVVEDVIEKVVLPSTECNVVKRGRGRPPKQKPVEVVVGVEASNVRTLKFLGYCSNTECTCALTDADHVAGDKSLVVCIRCNMEQKVSSLKQEKPVTRNVSKRAFLNDVASTHVMEEDDEVVTSYELAGDLSAYGLDE